MDFKLQVTIDGKGKVVGLEEFKNLLGIKKEVKKRKPAKKKPTEKKEGK